MVLVCYLVLHELGLMVTWRLHLTCARPRSFIALRVGVCGGRGRDTPLLEMTHGGTGGAASGHGGQRCFGDGSCSFDDNSRVRSYRSRLLELHSGHWQLARSAN